MLIIEVIFMEEVIKKHLQLEKQNWDFGIQRTFQNIFFNMVGFLFVGFCYQQYDYSSWKGKNVISVKDFSKQNVEEVLAVATRMKELVAKKGGCDVLNVNTVVRT